MSGWMPSTIDTAISLAVLVGLLLLVRRPVARYLGAPTAYRL